MIQFKANQDNSVPNTAFNDIFIDSDGIIVTCTGIEAIQQSVTSAIWMCLGDYDFDNTLGIPWVILFQQNPIDVSLLNYYLKNAILSINDYIPANELQDYKINNNISINIQRDATAFNYIINISYSLANGQILQNTFNTSALKIGK